MKNFRLAFKKRLFLVSIAPLREFVLADKCPADANQVVNELIFYVALFCDAGHKYSPVTFLKFTPYVVGR